MSLSQCVTVVPVSHCAGREVWRSHGWRLEQWRYSLRTSRGTFHPHCIANYRQIPMPSVPWLCWLGVGNNIRPLKMHASSVFKLPMSESCDYMQA